jgi:hypothetical protein
VLHIVHQDVLHDNSSLSCGQAFEANCHRDDDRSKAISTSGADFFEQWSIVSYSPRKGATKQYSLAGVEPDCNAGEVARNQTLTK